MSLVEFQKRSQLCHKPDTKPEENVNDHRKLDTSQSSLILISDVLRYQNLPAFEHTLPFKMSGPVVLFIYLFFGEKIIITVSTNVSSSKTVSNTVKK